MSKSISKSDSTADLLEKNRILEERIQQLESVAAAVSSSTKQSQQQQQLSPLQTKANSINRYWWPSHTDGGLIGKIYIQQHPSNCKSTKTKYLVWRSRPKPEDDTRGLTAWGHAGSSNLLHAFTDADSVPHYPSRVLINDDKVCMYVFLYDVHILCPFSFTSVYTQSFCITSRFGQWQKDVNMVQKLENVTLNH